MPVIPFAFGANIKLETTKLDDIIWEGLKRAAPCYYVDLTKPGANADS